MAKKDGLRGAREEIKTRRRAGLERSRCFALRLVDRLARSGFAAASTVFAATT